MKSTWCSGLALLGVMGACTRATGQPAVPDDDGAGVLAPVRELGGAFPTSPTCARCHSNVSTSTAMRDGQGAAIAPYDMWQGSMKANAARDPIFRAQLASEVARAPAAAAAIEATCLGCHAPVLSHDRAAQGLPPPRLAELDGNSDDAVRGLDSVSCIACHRMAAAGLGTEATFDGKFTLGPAGVIYGPFQAPFTRPMQMHTGYTPTLGAHMQDAGLCGSCHTLITHAIAPDGSPMGKAFDEQTPYLDYRNSAYPGEGVTCQTCHMPSRDASGEIATKIARRPDGSDFPPIGARAPYAKHVFAGANMLVPAMLRDEALLGASAPAAAFDATIAAAKAMLASAATLELGALTRDGNGYALVVTVRSHTGHKLPAGYPSRRMVLYVRARDAQGTVLLESGRMDADGNLVDEAGHVLPSELDPLLVEPHRDVIRTGREVQIWEQVPGDADGRPTQALLAAETMAKDNRILPRGFALASADVQRLAPVGLANDANFTGGADTVVLRFAQRPASLEVELHYQTLGARWRTSLLATNTTWSAALRDMLTRHPATPVVMTRVAKVY